jgi:hypothetical protein
MKKICIPLIGLLLSGTAAAQTHDWSASVTAGFNYLFVQNPSHVLGTSFPYTTTAATGTQHFNGSLQGGYHTEVPMFDLPGLDIAYRRLDFTLGVGLNKDLNNDYAWYVYSGASYAFPFRWATLKPGVRLVYFGARREKMGSIDNRGQTLSMFGINSGDQFTETYTNDDGNGTSYSYDQTYNTDHLDVDYSTHSLDLGPQIQLDLKPIGRVTFGLQAGWLIPVYQQSALRFVQVSNDDNAVTTNSLKSVTLPNNGSLGGAYAGVHASVFIGHLKITKS